MAPAPKAAEAPPRLGFKNVRTFAPVAKGAVIWWERQTKRVRARYVILGEEHQASWKSDDSKPEMLSDSLEAGLRWLWQQHTRATEERCPWPGLR